MTTENTLRTVVWYSTGVHEKTDGAYHLMINVTAGILGLKQYQSDPARPASCHRCRISRSLTLCRPCPLYARRFVWQGLEEGAMATLGVISVALLATAAISWGLLS